MRAPRALPVAVVLAFVLAPTASPQDDWPSFRHDARRSGVTTAELSASELEPAWGFQGATPRPAWHGPARWDAYAKLEGLRSMRDYDAVAQPVIVGERLYLPSSTDDALRCFDARRGTLEWTFHAGGPVRIAPMVHAGRVYFGSDDGYAYCVDAQSGALVWRFSPRPEERRLIHDGRLISPYPVRTGVVVEDGLAFFGASLLPWRPSLLCAVDASSGTLDTRAGTWVREHAGGLTLEGAMLATDDTLIVPQGRVAPLLFERATGRALGSLPGGGGSFCLLTEDDEVLHGPGNKAGWITASASDSRAQVASYDKGRAMVIEGSTAWLLSDRALSALDGAARSLQWTHAVERPLTLIKAGGTLVVGADGGLVARRASDGELLFQAELDGRVHGLAVAGGWLYASTDTGALVAYSPTAEPRDFDEPLAAGSSLGAPPSLQSMSTEALIARFAFQSDTAVGSPPAAFENLVSDGLRAVAQGPLTLAPAGALHAAELDGHGGDLLVGSDFRDSPMPERELTVEAWARVDAPTTWGGFIGAAQDNGEYERGWLLGYRENRFGFALAGDEGSGRLTWLLAPEGFAMGSWHQVVGSYDGERMCLFVDGELVATSEAESGAIRYPERAHFAIGAYHDDDEHFRMDGALQSCSLYARAMDAEEVASRWSMRSDQLPEDVSIEAEAPAADLAQLESGPVLRFPGGGRADIDVTTAEREYVVLEWSSAGEVLGRSEVNRASRRHAFALDQLDPRRLYTYRFLIGRGEDARPTAEFELDTHLDLTPSAVPGEPSARARALIAALPENDGMGLVLGLGDGELLIELARAGHAWTAITSDPRQALVVRERLAPSARGQEWSDDYPGERINVLVVDAEGPLRLPPAFAGAVVAHPDQPESARALIERGALASVRPVGGIAALLDDGAPEGDYEAAGSAGPWRLHTRGELPGAADWTHMYGRPDNSAFGGEALAGASSIDELAVQWIGRPGPRYQSDRQNRKPAPLAADGRLFLQGLYRVLALDAYSGTPLWGVELPELSRFNVPRSSANWCTDGDALYLALQDRCLVLDARDGERRAELQVPPGQRADADYEWGYVARVDDLLLGSSALEGSHFTEWWGGQHWYDAKNGEDASKVLSERLFALDADTGRERWSRSAGLVIDATITVLEDSLVFVESRNTALWDAASGRLRDRDSWDDLQLVCLDIATGDLRWERPAQPTPGHVAFYLAGADGRLVMLSSMAGSFALYAFDAESGDSVWRRQFRWEADHHGKHLSRPALVGGRVYVRPLVFELADGAIVDLPFPVGHQCGSYVASRDALFLRAGELCAWDAESGESTRWTRLRPDCWISTIPAQGMLLAPEGGGGCSCGSWLESSMAFLPRGVE